MILLHIITVTYSCYEFYFAIYVTPPMDDLGVFWKNGDPPGAQYLREPPVVSDRTKHDDLNENAADVHWFW